VNPWKKLNDKWRASAHEQDEREHRRTGETAMRVEKVSSQVAWSEREGKHSSAKRNAAVLVAALAALLVTCGSVHLRGAQRSAIQLPTGLLPEAIVTRDWKQWTAVDCDVILNYSSWGLSWTTEVEQLRSALPIREALLRQLQLKKHYDTMNSAEKLEFDKKNPPDLIETENDPILLYVEHDATYNGGEDVYPAQQAALRLADGTLVMPIKTEALQDDQDANKIVYSFPRVINGKPVLAPGDQKLNFVFGKPMARAGRNRPLQDPQKFKIHAYKFGSVPGTKQKMLRSDGLMTGRSFPIAGLMYNGKLEY
jgi:hypothetical protein